MSAFELFPEVYIVFTLLHLVMIAFLAFWTMETQISQHEQDEAPRRSAVQQPPPHALPARAAAAAASVAPVAALLAPELVLVDDFDSALLPPPPDVVMLRLACGVSVGRITYFLAGLLLPLEWNSLASPLATLSYWSLFSLASLLASMRWSLLHESLLSEAIALRQPVPEYDPQADASILRFIPRIRRPLPQRWTKLNKIISCSLLLCFLVMSGSELALRRIQKQFPTGDTVQMQEASSMPFVQTSPLASPSSLSLQCPALPSLLPDFSSPPSSLLPLQCAAAEVPLESSSDVLGKPNTRRRAIMHEDSPESSALESVGSADALLRVEATLIARRFAPTFISVLQSLRSAAAALGSLQLSLFLLCLGSSHIFLGCQLESCARPCIVLRQHSIQLHVASLLLTSALICFSSLCMCSLNLMSMLLPTTFITHFRGCQSMFLAAEIVLTLTITCAARIRIEPAPPGLQMPPSLAGEAHAAPAA